jgi:hypothetical protein
MRALSAALLLLITACGGSVGPAGNAPASTGGPLAADTANSTSAESWYACPSAQTSSGTLNCAALPLGDRKYSTSAPKSGYVYSCISLSGSPVVSSAPWLNASAGTWNALEKVVVTGSVAWNGSFTQKETGSERELSANLEPISPHTTGSFPIVASDPAYEYDRNPNKIEAHAESLTLPLNPSAASSPQCVAPGTIGVTLTGVAIYDGFDAAGYDAVAREEQDACHGHPDGSDTYHYHGWLQACVPDAGSAKQNSSLLGYALDGYGIYGPWYDGKVLTSKDLDECHGTTSVVLWNGKEQSVYHYVSTYDFPYTIGCFHGKKT